MYHVEKERLQSVVQNAIIHLMPSLKMKWKKLGEWFIVGLIYPIYSIWFGTRASLLYENLSYVGNLNENRLHFMNWALLTILSIYIGYNKCLKYAIFKNKLKKGMQLAAGLLILAVAFPYVPESYPFSSFIHLIFSMSAPLFILGLCGLLLQDLNLNYPAITLHYRMFYIIIATTSLCIYFYYRSVNTLVEIFISISLSLLLLHLGSRLEESE